MARLALVLTVTGCNSLLGVHDFVGDAGGDASGFGVTVSLVRRVITNDSAFEPLAMETPITAVTDVTLDDDSHPDITIRTDGTISFATRTPGQTYRFTTTEFGVLEVVDRASNLRVLFPELGRPDRHVITDPTVLMVSIGATYTDGISFLSTTGLWTNSFVGNMSTFNFDWRTANSLSGPIGELTPGDNDRLYYTHLAPLGTYYAIDQIYDDELALLDGNTVVFGGAPRSVARDRCAHVVIPFADELAALQTLYPAGQTTAAIFEIDGMRPGLDPFGGLTGALSNGVANFDGNVDFANVFPGTTSTLVDSVSVAHNTRGTGLTPHFASLVRGRVAPVVDCSQGVSTTTTVQVAVPSFPAIAGRRLDADIPDLVIANLPRVPLTWTLAAPGPVDRVSLQLVDVAQNGLRTVVRSWALPGDARELDLDPALFEVGKQYDVVLGFGAGFPHAADGDYATYGPSWANANVFTPTFTITPEVVP